MRVTLSQRERWFVHATIAFANSAVRDPHDVERRFPLASAETVRGGRVLVDRSALYRRLQETIRRWLAIIAESGEAARARIGSEVAEALRPGIVSERAADRRSGRRPIRRSVVTGRRVGIPAMLEYDARHHRLGITYTVTTVQAATAFGVALLLDRTRGLTGRLGRCGWCGRFRLTLRGKPRRYCNREHYQLHDEKQAVERVRRMRERRRRQRKPKR